tara:strand:- start:760 stop:1617 length:858 start_codon:yes stop_codon:yes gene_type:complete
MPNPVNRDNNKPMTDAQLKAVAVANIDTTTTTTTTDQPTYPTEVVQLPTKGKLYPKDHPLANGTIEMKYMTAREEDILTNQSFIANGVVLDKLFKALIVTPIDYNDLFLGDKNAVMIAARVLGYGKEYPIEVPNGRGEQIEYTVDLTNLEDKEIDWSVHESGKNEFQFELPASKHMVTVKILTQGDQKKIDQELKGLQKLKKSPVLTTMLKHVIIGLDGDTDNIKIRKFIDNNLLALDSRALRQYLKTITPDINLSLEIPDGESGDTFRSQLPIGLDFFWPDSEI